MDLEQLLKDRFTGMGIDSDMVPRIIKDISTFFNEDPTISLAQLNRQLTALGWDDLSIDYRTYELIKEYFEMGL